MSLSKTITVNEFFVRLTEDGTAIQGVHVADLERIMENGTSLTSRMLSPRPVNANDAVVLGPIAQAFNLAALATVDAQGAQIVQLTTEKQAALIAIEGLNADVAALNTAKQEVLAERDAAMAAAQALQAQLDALKTPAAP